MSTAAVTPDNGNPFNQPLDSEVQESAQRQAASQQASPNGNPFDEPLVSEIAEREHEATSGIEPSLTGTAREYSSKTGGADVQPVTQSTNPKLASAMAGADEPEFVGLTGAIAAGTMGATALNEVAAPVVKHITAEYGQPAIKAIEAAAKSHPIVAKLIGHALETAGGLTLAKYMNLFSSKK